jgi:hypothetical protein
VLAIRRLQLSFAIGKYKILAEHYETPQHRADDEPAVRAVDAARRLRVAVHRDGRVNEPSSDTVGGLDHLRGSFADHDARCHRVAAGDVRHDRGVGYAQFLPVEPRSLARSLIVRLIRTSELVVSVP